MLDKKLPQKRAVADIVFAYRMVTGQPGKPRPLRQFAQDLNEFLTRPGETISHQTIKNWEDRTHLPHHALMSQIALHGRGWPRDFAEDILAALNPKLCQPATEIGARAIARSLIETGPQKRRYDSRYTNPPG